MISSRTLSNFTATVQAFDNANNLLGTYAIVANGLGGTCIGLAVLSPNPQPCTDSNSAFYSPAPWVEVLGSNRDISKLVIQTNDNTGLFIDQMFLNDSQTIPEPSALVLMSGGFGLLAWLRFRRGLRYRSGAGKS
jgi:hypothetical protein